MEIPLSYSSVYLWRFFRGGVIIFSSLDVGLWVWYKCSKIIALCVHSRYKENVSTMKKKIVHQRFKKNISVSLIFAGLLEN